MRCLEYKYKNEKDQTHGVFKNQGSGHFKWIECGLREKKKVMGDVF